MDLVRRHDWNLTPTRAVALQRELADEIVADKALDLDAVRLVAGVDVSVKNDRSHAAIVVATYPDFRVVETVTALMPTPFPYVPGLLSFREGPVLEEAFGRLKAEPDVFLFDGMGTAHPRRIGIASHLGLWLQRPTIGVGKTRLCGRNAPLAEEKGAHQPLIDKGETIGAVVRTRTGKHPLFISPGHLADIPSSVALVLACAPKFRLPEPIRLAHKAAGAFG
ncbi:deoxyribonuclease V [Methylobacterium sp. SyP6R]|uniref:deoxyribonuclease V n=1 Tax=Methylobacterium sp. SyP6R TaxID=2718876 RepID=UPI001EEEC771|nr:deoxyribonuclease V [Methylobacterium sp. SyP6R]MCF4126990.1 deoxyribonuclease V [Methylobacterium sp. SyP6R]